jgi:integrase
LPKNPHWRARFKDPETGKTRVQTLTMVDAKTSDTRLGFATRLHKAISRRRDDIVGGASPHRTADLSVSDAFDRYFEAWGALKSEQTVRVYRDACKAFVAWGDATGLRTVRQLSKGRLRDFAASRAKIEKRAPASGGKRGESRAAGRRSPHSINKELRSIATVLNTLRKMEVVRVTRDDLADGLERLSAPVERRDFLQPAQLRALLVACRTYDAALFKIKRDGSKDAPRFKPITPVVLFILLTGTRSGEALEILWSDVSSGEIHIRAEVSKTKQARTIDLSVSPALETMLVTRAEGRVFNFTGNELDAARKRLTGAEYKAPAFTWHGLRRTCGTFLTCAPGIFGAASAYRSARQLGHSVVIAERHYVGVVKIAADARTLEAAMQIEDLV